MLPWSVKNYPLLPARSQVLILLHRQTHSQISPLHSRLLRLLGLFSMLETTALPSHPQTICSPLLRRLHCLQGKDQGRLSEELKLCGILTVLWVFNMPFVYTYSAHASAEQSHRKRMICNSAAVIPLSSTRKVRVVMNTVQTCDVIFPYWHLISVVNDQWSRGRVIPIGHSATLPRSGLFPSNYVEQLWIKMICETSLFPYWYASDTALRSRAMLRPLPRYHITNPRLPAHKAWFRISLPNKAITIRSLQCTLCHLSNKSRVASWCSKTLIRNTGSEN